MHMRTNAHTCTLATNTHTHTHAHAHRHVCANYCHDTAHTGMCITHMNTQHTCARAVGGIVGCTTIGALLVRTGVDRMVSK